MKPGSYADRMARKRKLLETARQARGEELEAYIRSGGSMAEVRPELIPTRGDLDRCIAETKKLMRLLDGRGRAWRRRAEKLDELVVKIATLIFLERVMELDRLERAGLTPQRLVALSAVSPDMLSARLARFRGETGLVVS